MALVQISEEQITVSSSSIGVTSTLLVDTSGDVTGVKIARFAHESGGIIRVNAKTAPAANGTVGAQKTIGDEWQVSGFDDLNNFRMIKETSESDATVNVMLFGTP
jgi:hypothetical protein